MDRYIGVKSRGVSNSTLEELSNELREAKGVVQNADPNLLLLELEQVEKKMSKYKVPALGYPKVEKPDG